MNNSIKRPQTRETRAQAKHEKSLEKMRLLKEELLSEFKRSEGTRFVPKFSATTIRDAVNLHAEHIGTWPESDLIGVPTSYFQQLFDEQTISHLKRLRHIKEKEITCLDDFIEAAGYERGENNEMIPVGP